MDKYCEDSRPETEHPRLAIMGLYISKAANACYVDDRDDPTNGQDHIVDCTIEADKRGKEQTADGPIPNSERVCSWHGLYSKEVPARERAPFISLTGR